MIEFDVTIACDGCGKSMSDSESTYCHKCAKEVGVEKNTRSDRGDCRSLLELNEAEKSWYDSVRRQSGELNV